MLSKLVAYAPTREAAIARMLRALDEYVIGGIRTNLAFFRRILRDPDFQAARIDTGYLERLLANRPGSLRLALPRNASASPQLRLLFSRAKSPPRQPRQRCSPQAHGRARRERRVCRP